MTFDKEFYTMESAKKTVSWTLRPDRFSASLFKNYALIKAAFVIFIWHTEVSWIWRKINILS